MYWKINYLNLKLGVMFTLNKVEVLGRENEYYLICEQQIHPLHDIRKLDFFLHSVVLGIGGFEQIFAQ